MHDDEPFTAALMGASDEPTPNYAINGMWFQEHGVEAKVGEPVNLTGAMYSWNRMWGNLDTIKFSFDMGTSWVEYDVDKEVPDFDPYQWVNFSMDWTPAKAGTYLVKMAATDDLGNEMPFSVPLFVRVSEQDRDGHVHEYPESIKTLGGVMSAVALISGGAGVAQAATVDSAAPAPAMPVVTAASDSAAPEAPGARTVEGSFSYDQDAVTANAEISGVFCKAAATLCASLPTYGCETAKAAAITVAGPGASFTATADELAGEEGAASYVMACSCATNVAGGGAIANAEVEGVSLETLVQMACA